MNREKFTTAGTTAKNEKFNDIAIITSKVPFVLMEAFLKKAFERLDAILLQHGIEHQCISVQFYPATNQILKGGLSFIRFNKNGFHMHDVSGTRVQFHFIGTHPPRNEDDLDQLKIYKIHTENNDEFHQAIKIAFNEVMLEEHHY